MMADIFKDWPRFDGAATWSSLTPEHVVCMNGEDAYFTGLEAKPGARPFLAAGPLLVDKLIAAVQDAIIDKVPALDTDALPVPIPSLLGPVCRSYGCSEEDACDGGCNWAQPDLCSACSGMPERADG
jgi:hypothetical protein